MSVKVHTIGRGRSVISVRSGVKEYIVGFHNVVHARRTFYEMHPEVEIKLYRGDPRGAEIGRRDGACVIAYPTALAYIKKLRGEFFHPMNDGGFHLNTISHHEYAGILQKPNMGLLMPHSLVDEDSSVDASTWYLDADTDGYGSDTTRTIWVTGPNAAVPPTDDFLRRYEILKRAHQAAMDHVRPGVSCESVDAAARAVIDAAGEGARFFHRTGHGIGLEEHEDPYIVAGNTTKLVPGHAFSIEPGIYVEGVNGARIEDIVLCGDSAVDALNHTKRDLYVVAG